jgi:hypothetical protein
MKMKKTRSGKEVAEDSEGAYRWLPSLMSLLSLSSDE